MGKGKISLFTNQLTPGMFSAQEVLVNNQVLISCGKELTEPIIKKLREVYFESKLLVFTDEEEIVEDKKSPVPILQERTVKEIEKEFQGFSKDIEDMFSKIQNSRQIHQEVREFAKKILEEISSTSAIVKNIVLKGSGQDCLHRHSVNVAALSSILGRWVGLSENEVNLLMYSAILHDFGKSKIEDEILYKAEPLTKDEFDKIKKHPIIGYEFIKAIPYLSSSVSYGVLMHHERIDGTGYPMGLKEDKIHKFGKIIAIADTFDAVNSNRVHKKSKNPFEALEIIKKDSLGKLDYEYCKIFIEHIVNYYIGEEVLINTGEVCKIIKIDVNNLTEPLLMSPSRFIDLRQEKGLFVKKLVIQ